MEQTIETFLNAISEDLAAVIDDMASKGKDVKDIADSLAIPKEQYEGLSLFVSDRYEYWMLFQRRTNLHHKLAKVSPNITKSVIDAIADSLDAGREPQYIEHELYEAIRVLDQIVRIHGELIPTFH